MSYSEKQRITMLEKFPQAIGDVESQFGMLPSEIKYKIFARLDAKSLALARVVCTNWNNLLNRSTLQALTQNPKLCTTSLGFLIKSCYHDITDTHEESPKELFISIDHEGICKAAETLNTNLHVCCDWHISSNGVLFSFRFEAEDPKVVVCHPSLRWIEVINLGDIATSDTDYENTKLQGAFFDPCTSNFTLLIGLEKAVGTPCSYELHTYRSVSRQWETLAFEMDPLGSFKLECFSGVFSQGCFFWVDDSYPGNPDKALVVFDTSDIKLHRISLPMCPVHLGHGVSEKDYAYGWELRGCDRNLVLVHYCTIITDPFTEETEKLVCWKLELNEGIWNCHLLVHQPRISIVHNNNLFDTDKSGWWLWAEQVDWDSRESQKDLVMLNDRGDVQCSIPMSNLGPLPPDSYAYVGGLWELDINTLWDVLASS